MDKNQEKQKNVKEESELLLTSPSFVEGDWIPNRHSGYGEDISPELSIEGIDENAVSMILTLDDLGHPIQPGYNHWVAWNIPPINIIPENLPKGAVIEKPIHVEQGVAYGNYCYRGPKPPFNWNHEYVFTVYILDVKLNIDQDSDKPKVLESAKGHILQTATLKGKYQRKHK